MVQQPPPPPSGPGPPHYRDISLTDTPYSVGLLWRRDQPIADTQLSQEKDIYVSGGIRTRNPCKLAAADPRLRPRGNTFSY